MYLVLCAHEIFDKILTLFCMNHSHRISFAFLSLLDSWKESVILCQSVVQIFTRTWYIDLDILPASLLENLYSSLGHPVYVYVGPDIVCARGGGGRVENGRMTKGEREEEERRGRWGSRKWTVAWNSSPYTSPRYNGVSNRWIGMGEEGRGGGGGAGRMVTGEGKGPTFVHVRLKFSVGFQWATEVARLPPSIDTPATLFRVRDSQGWRRIDPFHLSLPPPLSLSLSLSLSPRHFLFFVSPFF